MGKKNPSFAELPIQHILTLVECIDAGSFSAVARRLGVSAALLSKRVAALEAAIGVCLIHRTTRSFAVSAAGAALLPAFRSLVATVQDCNATLQRVTGAMVETIDVDIPDALVRRTMMPHLRAFATETASCTLDFRERGRPPRFGALGTVAIAIGETAPATPHAVKIAELEPQFYVSATVLQSGETLAIEDVAARGVVCAYASAVAASSLMATHISSAEPDFIFDIDRRLVSDDACVLTAAVGASDFILLALDRLIAPEVRDGRLTRILSEWRLSPLSLWLTSSVAPDGSPAVARLLSYLMPAPIAGVKPKAATPPRRTAKKIKPAVTAPRLVLAEAV